MIESPQLPETTKPVVVILSGGLDSSTVLIAATEKYQPEGRERADVPIYAISFYYGQKQMLEFARAEALCELLGVSWNLIHLNGFGEMVSQVSANIDGSPLAMPTIEEVLGDPAPATYVPNRNMVMFAMAASYAEALGSEVILCGLQSNDEYNYHDTTPSWLEKCNQLLSENRKHQIKIYAPVHSWNKAKEVAYVSAMDVIPFLRMTLTCYNPDDKGRSCAKCPSCAERIRGFMENGIKDPLTYAEDIAWPETVSS